MEPEQYRTKQARADIEDAAKWWEACNKGPQKFTRITLAKRIASKDIPDKVWVAQEVGKAISLLLDQAEASE